MLDKLIDVLQCLLTQFHHIAVTLVVEQNVQKVPRSVVAGYHAVERIHLPQLVDGLPQAADALVGLSFACHDGSDIAFHLPYV